MNPSTTSIMPEKDLVYSLLANEKRVVREYATATTESNCQVVRQMFTDLLNDTLQIQTQLYDLMSRHGWYNTSSSAVRTEVQKQVQFYGQTQQELQQFQQRNSGYQWSAPQMQNNSAMHHSTQMPYQQ